MERGVTIDLLSNSCPFVLLHTILVEPQFPPSGVFKILSHLYKVPDYNKQIKCYMCSCLWRPELIVSCSVSCFLQRNRHGAHYKLRVTIKSVGGRKWLESFTHFFFGFVVILLWVYLWLYFCGYTFNSPLPLSSTKSKTSANLHQ